MRHAARTVVLALMLVIVAPVAVVVGLMRRRGRPVRSLWVTHPIPTVPAKAKAERMLGAQVETWAFETGRLEHRFDRVLLDSRQRAIVGGLTPFMAFVRACGSFDRLHFFCDRGLLPLFHPRMFNPLELMIYRLLGKEVFFWAYGADVRTQESTRALGEPNACSQCPSPGRFCICSDKGGLVNQRRIAATAAAVFAIGDMKRYTPGSVTDLFYWPIDLDDSRYEPVYPSSGGEIALRVAHAPNHRHFKGTNYLVEAVEALRSGGLAIELDLIEDLTNDEALARYRSADVIFDQCLIGFHGYFALEAMALGKPVLCFIRDRADLLAPDECPIINIAPGTIAGALESLAGDRERVESLGRAGRGYIERYYSVGAFAGRYQAALATLGATGS
jgi:hypothetical protein